MQSVLDVLASGNILILKAVLDKRVHKESFELMKVVTNAMEIREPDTAVIWALGANAWYQLVSPSDDYREIFNVMETKVKLWMTIDSEYYERYLDGDKRAAGLKVSQFFKKVWNISAPSE